MVVNEFKKNLYLIGFMGTGKSTVGRKVAEKLGYFFIDIDQSIEKLAKKSIPSIFNEEGEAHFRQLEFDFVMSGHPEAGCVISCGGGLACQTGMIDLLKRKGMVVCLWASIETILERTSGSQSRPLLNSEYSDEKVRKLLADRTPYYNQAHASLTTEFRTVQEVVQHIVRIYNS